MLRYERVAGDRIVLRQPRRSDVDDIAAACADPLVQRFIPSMPSPYTREDAISWIANADRFPDRIAFVIASPETDRLLGGCALHHLSRTDLSGEVGYWVAPWARRRGVATAATIALGEFGFRRGLGRIELLTRPDNTASQRVAIAAGYRREGRRRAAGVDRQGARYDLVAWARLATDPPGPSPRLLPDLPAGRLRDGTVELRPIDADDAIDVAALRRLPEVVATSVPAVLPSAAAVAEMCAHAPSQWLTGERAALAIRDAASGAFAGTIELFGVEPPTGQATIGYDLLPDFRGRGFATRAVRLLAGWVFTGAGLARLVAGTAPGNVASQRVLERAGFRREGLRYGALPGPAGTRLDDIRYGLVSPTRTRLR
jgi:RimJ/RimL family protein N-acetyltransferase